MKRAALTIAGTIAGLAVLLGFKTQPIGQELTASLAPTGTRTDTSSTSTATGGTAAKSSGAGSGTSQPTATRQTVTGDAASTPYGPVQVKVTSSGGQIVDVEVVQAPWSNAQDQQINGYALPILVQETLDAQTANIDMVSGATYTSNGYVTSLQSALDQIHA